MKKSSNVLLSAVFLTSVAAFQADQVHAQQNASNTPEQTRQRDSTSHHSRSSGYVGHRGFFGRIFHRAPASNQNVTTNDGPRRNETPLKTDAAVAKSSGGFGSTGKGSAHS